MDNHQVARTLRELARLLELEGESAFKVRAYLVAADRVAALGTPVERLASAGRLEELPGIGPAIAAKIEQLVAHGTLPQLARLQARYPAGTAALLEVPELGPRKVAQLLEAGIDSVDALERAAEAGTLAQVKGFGGKSQAAVLEAIASRRRHAARLPLADALPRAEELLAHVREDPGVRRASIAGSIRRWEETVGGIDLVADTADPDATLAWFERRGTVRERSAGHCTVELPGGALAHLHLVPADGWATALLRHTGSRAHLDELGARAEAMGFALQATGLYRRDGTRLELAEEETIYAALGLQPLPPELREEGADLEHPPALVELHDVRGLTHCHTTWSDGKQSVLEMAQAARALGYEYLTITDHSQASHYARGLTPDRLRAQWDEIAAAAEAVPEVRILRGSEVDILADGRLDFDEALLGELDVVIGSIHQRHGLDEAAQTRRLCRALAHPLLSWIGHPTGRLVGSRDPYPLHMERVLEEAAARGKALEVNGTPRRLDLSAAHVHLARSFGVRLVVSTDAHSTAGFAALRYGIATARRGGATAGDVLNTRRVEAFLAALRGRQADEAPSVH